MGKLPEEINKILSILDSLDESPAEKIFFDHLRHVLQEQTTLNEKKETSLVSTIRDLLKQLVTDANMSGSEIAKQLAFLNALLEPPCTLPDLESVTRSIKNLLKERQTANTDKPGSNPLAILPAHQTKDIAKKTNENNEPSELKKPPGSSDEELSNGSIEFQKIQHYLSKKITSLTGNSQKFGEQLNKVVETLKSSNGEETVEQARRTLIDQALVLSEGYHQLQHQLEKTREHLKFLENNSHDLNSELKRARLLSLTDDLTGLPNRRAFLRRLEDEVGRVRRYDMPLSLAIIDLDFFKSINDDYGHGAGDEALRVFSSQVLSIFRHLDLVARYGGEEFIVLMPNTDHDGAARALEKIQQQRIKTSFKRNGETASLPAFSAGVALYKPGETATDFIDRADRALYQAKNLGRNRVEFDEFGQPGTLHNWTERSGR